MKKQAIAFSIAIIVILLSGFVIAAISDGVNFCTKKACSCQNDNEVECNTCGTYKPLYFSILLNYGKTCQTKEIMICQDGEETGKRYDVVDDKCEYLWNSILTRNEGITGMSILE